MEIKLTLSNAAIRFNSSSKSMIIPILTNSGI